MCQRGLTGGDSWIHLPPPSPTTHGAQQTLSAEGRRVETMSGSAGGKRHRHHRIGAVAQHSALGRWVHRRSQRLRLVREQAIPWSHSISPQVPDKLQRARELYDEVTWRTAPQPGDKMLVGSILRQADVTSLLLRTSQHQPCKILG